MEKFYLGRQAILDRDGDTFGYELLFRSSAQNAYDPNVDGDTATARVVGNAVLELGLERIVGDGLAFINLTSAFLENTDLLTCLPPEKTVLEILETVQVTPSVIDGVRRLKDSGYTLALDDFDCSAAFEPLLEMVDIVKYDLTGHEHDALVEAADRDVRAGRRPLVERVETVNEFEALKAAGFELFQGYYFAKPSMVGGRKLSSNRLAQLQVLARINDPTTSMDELAEAIGRDVSLAVRVLKFVNSPVAGLRTEVNSIKQALTLLGRDTVRNWVTLLVMAEQNDKPQELISMCLVRARFCQLAAKLYGETDAASCFTIGLMSLLDVLLDTDMNEIVDSMSASSDVRAVLLAGEGPAGRLIDTVKLLERGAANEPFIDAAPVDVAPVDSALLEAYENALLWADETQRCLAA